MSAATGHPLKTELGLDELRRRTRGLSQRHRTMLLLVNGKRTRREVLTLAGQAGVGAEFFDELVAMGLVDPAPQPGSRGVEIDTADAVAARVFAAPSEWPSTGPPLDIAAPAAPTVEARRDAAATAAAPPSEVALPVASSAEFRASASHAFGEIGAGAASRPAYEPAPAPPLPAVPPKPPKSPIPAPAGKAPKAAAIVHAAAASQPPRPRRAAPPVLTLEDAVPLDQTRAAPSRPVAARLEPSAPSTSSASPTPSAPHTKPAAMARGAGERPVARSTPAPERAVATSAPAPVGARVRFTSTVHKPKAPARRAPPVELKQEPRLTPAKPPARAARIKMPAPAGPLDEEAECRLLAEVRSLLISTLLVDGPVTSSLAALRVRKARNRYDLTALVWEIERTLVRAKRPREAQSRLSKARDLLGLGNTVVDEETSPGRLTRS